MEVDEKDVQDTLSVQPYKAGVSLRLSSPFSALPELRYSLFTVSQVFGWAMVAINSADGLSPDPAFALMRLDYLQKVLDEADVYSTPELKPDSTQAVFVPTTSYCSSPSATITQLAFAAWDRLILVATSDGAIYIFSLLALVNRSSLAPFRCITSPGNFALTMMVPNPSPGGSLSGVVAAIYADGMIQIFDCYKPGETYWTSQSVTAAEWSPMGKRLVVGYQDGRLEFVTHDGKTKGMIQPPSLVTEEGLSVLHIKWLDQKNHIITFSKPEVPPNDLHETYCLHVARQTESPPCTFSRIADATLADGDLRLPPNRHLSVLPVNPKTNWKHFVIMAFSNSTALNVLGYDPADRPARLNLSEDERPELPAVEADYSYSAPLGLAISYSLAAKQPLIWCYTTDGVLAIWKIQLTGDSVSSVPELWGEIQVMSEISEAPGTGTERPPSPVAASSSHNISQSQVGSAPVATAFGGSAPVVAAFGGSGHAATTFRGSGPVATAFGVSVPTANAFGQSSTFGQSSPFGQPSAFGAPSFGQPAAFGQSSGFGQASAKSSAIEKVSSFGSSSPFSKSSASAFPSSSSSAFGQSAFGSSGSSFGSNAFGRKDEQVPGVSTVPASKSGLASFAVTTDNPGGSNFAGGFAQFTTGATASTFLDSSESGAKRSIFDQPDSAESKTLANEPCKSPTQLHQSTGHLLHHWENSVSTTSAKDDPFSKYSTPSNSFPGFRSASSQTGNIFQKPESKLDALSLGPKAFQPRTSQNEDVDNENDMPQPEIPGLSSNPPSPIDNKADPSITGSAPCQTDTRLQKPKVNPDALSDLSLKSLAFQPPQSQNAGFEGEKPMLKANSPDQSISPSPLESMADLSVARSRSKENKEVVSADASIIEPQQPRNGDLEDENHFLPQSSGPSLSNSPSSLDTKADSCTAGLRSEDDNEDAFTDAPTSHHQPSANQDSANEFRLSKSSSSSSSIPSLRADNTPVPSVQSLQSKKSNGEPNIDARIDLPANLPTSDAPESQKEQFKKQPASNSPATSPLVIAPVSSVSFGFGGLRPSDQPDSKPSLPFALDSKEKNITFAEAAPAATSPAISEQLHSPQLHQGVKEGQTSSFPSSPSPSVVPSASPLSFGFGGLKLSSQSETPRTKHVVTTVPTSASSAKEVAKNTSQAELPGTEKGLKSRPQADWGDLPPPPDGPESDLDEESESDTDNQEKHKPHSAEASAKSLFGLASSPPNKVKRSGTSPDGDSPEATEPGKPSSKENVAQSSVPQQPHPEQATLDLSHQSPASSNSSSSALEISPKVATLSTAVHHEHNLNPRSASASSVVPLAPDVLATTSGNVYKNSLPPGDSSAALRPAPSRHPTFLTTPDSLPIPIVPLLPSMVPKISANPVSEPLPVISQGGLDQALAKIVDSMTCEIECLSSVSSVCQCYMAECKKQLQGDPTAAEQTNHKNWQMGDLPGFYLFVQRWIKIAQKKKLDIERRFQPVTALESAMTKADLKGEEIRRVLRLRNDPGFSKVVRTRQLGPVQLAHQKEMRRLIRDVKHGIFQMSEVLQSFKTQKSEANTRRSRMQTPSLDTINRSIRYITLGLTQHIIDIEKLNTRVRKHKALSSSLHQQGETTDAGPNPTLAHGSNSQTSEREAALRALLNEHKGAILKESILYDGCEPILTRTQSLRDRETAGKLSGLSHIISNKTLVVKPRFQIPS